MNNGPLALVPLAVHISDGVLVPSWLAGGFLVAGLLAFLGSRRIRDEEIPRIALLTAAFFVASLPHIPGVKAHLLLGGLMGIVLGPRVTLAVPIALFLQAGLGHGGFLALGVNSCVMELPALFSWQLFRLLQRVPWVRRPWFRSGLVGLSILPWVVLTAYSVTLLITNWDYGRAAAVAFHPAALLLALTLAGLAVWKERRLEAAPEFAVGMLIGELAVLLTVLLHYVALVWGGPETWYTLGLAVFVAHLPIAVFEGVILGFAVGFLAQVKPEMLGLEAGTRDIPVPRAERPPELLPSEASAEKASCSADPVS